MNKEKLDNLIKLIYEKYDPMQYEGAINCVMPGYFGGNKVLFIAQNPGELKEDVLGDMTYLRAFQEKRYDAASKCYALALRSSRGTYGTFINDIYSDNWSDISITNVFKCPFKNNILPELITVPKKEINILRKQIEYINPLVIVAVGALAQQAIFQIDPEQQRRQLHCYHPSYLKRTGRYEQEIVNYHLRLSAELYGAAE